MTDEENMKYRALVEFSCFIFSFSSILALVIAYLFGASVESQSTYLWLVFAILAAFILGYSRGEG